MVRLSGGMESGAGSLGQSQCPGRVIHCPETFGHSAQGKREVEVADLEGP